MTKGTSQDQRDELLRGLLQILANRGLAANWASLRKPHLALITECRTLARKENVLQEFQLYLRSNPVIQLTVDTLLSHLAMTANVKWQDTPDIIHPLSRRGWYLSRWLPTFLIIDGPLGRFLRKSDSPLNSLLKREYAIYPVLAQARDTFNHQLFRQVRNGVGHWSFYWKEERGNPHLVVIDSASNKPEIKVTLMEAEALHLVAFSVIEALDEEVFSKANPRFRG